jgi:hypothetical protein
MYSATQRRQLFVHGVEQHATIDINLDPVIAPAKLDRLEAQFVTAEAIDAASERLICREFTAVTPAPGRDWHDDGYGESVAMLMR